MLIVEQATCINLMIDFKALCACPKLCVQGYTSGATGGCYLHADVDDCLFLHYHDTSPTLATHLVSCTAFCYEVLFIQVHPDVRIHIYLCKGVLSHLVGS